jgi:trimeric autotransporter adhesin
MRNLRAVILLILLIQSGVYGQSPQAFKYQAALRDSVGETLQNQAVGIRVSIHNLTASGNIIYQETFADTTNQHGIVNLEIGLGMALVGTLSGIDWGVGSKFLEIEIDPAGGINYQLMGTSELLSVPYALFSQSSNDSVWDKNGNNIYYNSGNVGIGNPNPGASLDVTGPIWQSGTGHSVILGEEAGTNDDYSNNQNSFVGYRSGYSNTSGSTNTFIGALSGFSTTIGETNTFLGHASGYNNTEGDNNTCLGYRSGYSNVTGTKNVCLGFRAGYYETGSNKLYIHNDAAYFPLIYGEFDNNLVGINGKLGVGTSSPQELLELNGNNATAGLRVAWGNTYEGLFGEFKYAGPGIGLKINSQTPSGTGTWADISLQTNGTTKMFIESAGKVGIGTMSPADDLHVAGHIRVGEDLIYPTIYGELIHDGAGTGFKINAAGGGWADLHLQTQGTTKMFIESAGNIGIGTTSPGAKLEVAGSIWQTGLGDCVFLGKSAGANDDGTSNRNSFVGHESAYSNTSGGNNTVYGYRANYNNQAGSSNTIIGYAAGRGLSLHNKSGNVFLGCEAGYYELGDNKLYIDNSSTSSPLLYGEFDNNCIAVNGNLGIGTKYFGVGSRTLALVNGTVPVGSITDGVLLYSQGNYSELKVRDEAGYVTTLSPHNFSMINKSEPMAWSFYCENSDIGKKINVDMLRMVRLIEEVSGEKLAYIKNIEDYSHTVSSKVNPNGIIQKQQKEIDNLKTIVEELQLRIRKLEDL